jgi:hypothetical protein
MNAKVEKWRNRVDSQQPPCLLACDLDLFANLQTRQPRSDANLPPLNLPSPASFSAWILLRSRGS